MPVRGYRTANPDGDVNVTADAMQAEIVEHFLLLRGHSWLFVLTALKREREMPAKNQKMNQYMFD